MTFSVRWIMCSKITWHLSWMNIYKYTLLAISNRQHYRNWCSKVSLLCEKNSFMVLCFIDLEHYCLINVFHERNASFFVIIKSFYVFLTIHAFVHFLTLFWWVFFLHRFYHIMTYINIYSLSAFAITKNDLDIKYILLFWIVSDFLLNF